MELGEAFSFLVSKWEENVIKLKRKNVKNDAYIGYIFDVTTDQRGNNENKRNNENIGYNIDLEKITVV